MKKKKLKLNIIENPKSLSTSFVINLKDLSSNKKRNHYPIKSFLSRKKMQVNFASKIKKSFIKFNFKIFTKRSTKKLWSRKLRAFSQVLSQDKRDYRQEIIWHKSILSFIIVLILLIVPFKFLSYLKVIDISSLQDRVFNHSQAAFENLILAGDSVKSLDLYEASDNFSLASGDFSQASEELERFNTLLLNLAKYSKDPKFKLASMAPHFLEAGKISSDLGRHLSLSFEAILNDSNNWENKLNLFFKYNKLALNEVDKLNKVLDKIDPKLIPKEHQEIYLFYEKIVNDINGSLLTIDNLQETFYTILGLKEKQRYLLVFQNNYEIRASGGFMGSYALADVLKGEIINLEVPSGGTYDTQAGMTSFIAAPKALRLVNPRWYFWDANWWPDWPTSAKNIMWLYEKSSGPSVDGVLAFNLAVLESLLQMTGPIDLSKEYGLIIDEKNFWLLLQKTVEKKNLLSSHSQDLSNIPDSAENEPKQIIADLMSSILEILPEKLNFESLSFLIQSFDKHLKSKDILIYFNDSKVQDEIENLGLSAAVLSTDYDYLMLTNTNIAGQKTDKVMEDRVFLDTKILEDGTIVNELTIAKKHTGFKNEIFTGVRNVNWLRVYVPEGSILISASGFNQPDLDYFQYPEDNWEVNSLIKEGEGKAKIDPLSQTLIYQELNKTVFANWTMTDPQEHSVIKIKYQLPFKFTALNQEEKWLDKLNLKEKEQNYFHSLILQKQAGMKDFQFYSRLRLYGNWQVNWSYPADISSSQLIWSIDEVINKDKIWAFNAQPYSQYEK
jgi:hypothetical protein